MTNNTLSFITISPFQYPIYVKNYKKHLDHYIFHQHGTAFHTLHIKGRYYHAFDPIYFKNNDDHQYLCDAFNTNELKVK